MQSGQWIHTALCFNTGKYKITNLRARNMYHTTWTGGQAILSILIQKHNQVGVGRCGSQQQQNAC